jgi:PAS domain S-box-containing protein
VLSDVQGLPTAVFDAEGRCVAAFGDRLVDRENRLPWGEAAVGRPAEETMGRAAKRFVGAIAEVLASRKAKAIRGLAPLPGGELVLDVVLWPLARLPLVACQLANVGETDLLRRRLATSEERLRMLGERGSDFVCEIDAAGRILYVGEKGRELLADPGKLLGLGLRHAMRLYPSLDSSDRVLLEAELGRFLDGEPFAPLRIRLRDLADIPRTLAASAAWYTTSDGMRRGLLVFRDAASEAGGKATEPLVLPRPGSAILDAVIELTPEGEIVSATALPIAWAGHDEALAGRSAAEFVHPEDHERAHKAFAQAARGLGYQPIDLRWRTADGAWRWLEVRVVALETGPGCMRLVAMARDTTNDRTVTQAGDAESLELLQRDNLTLLAAGVAHDFNNLLTISLGIGDLISKQLPAESPIRPYLGELVAASRQAAELARNLLAAAGNVSSSARAPLDLNALLASQAALARVALPKPVQLEVSLCEGPLWVEGEGTPLRQVVLNLVANAAEAIGPAPGVIRVASARIEGSTHADEAAPRDWAVIEISDDGPGVSEALRRRIFEPRFTTKSTGHGLGLTVVSNVVRRHGGRIDVTSAGAATGTTFRIELPLLAEPDEAGERRFLAQLESATESPGAVLLIADEESVRRIGATMLSLAHFRVIEAADPSTALAFAESEPDIGCAVVDLALSDRDGLELIAELQRRKPGICFVACSGAVDRLPLDRADLTVLEKPYRFAQLIEAVWRVFDGRRS